MKSYQIVLLRSSQVVQLSLFTLIMSLIVFQFVMVAAAIFEVDLGIHFADNITFGIYG